MREIIINTPQDSGLGDSLFVAFNKVNAMTLELYNQDASFSGELQTISAIVDTINDGVSTLNHKHTLDQIIGLQVALSGKVSTTTFNTQIAAINASIVQINSTISHIIDELQTKVDEAPFSGITYGRRDGAWVEISGGTPTLQQVLDFNHDLVDGIFNAGTGAGNGNTAINQNAIGPNAGAANTGNYQNAMGESAGQNNIGAHQNVLGQSAGEENQADYQNAFGNFAGSRNEGIHQNAMGLFAGRRNVAVNQNAFGSEAGFDNSGENQNAFGNQAGYQNTGSEQNAFGIRAGQNNTGNNQNALGSRSGLDNSGNELNAMGESAGRLNTGNDVNAFGVAAGFENAFNNVNLFGSNAQATADGQTVLSKDGSIMARIDTSNLTDSRQYDLPDASGTIALLSDLNDYVPYTGATEDVDLGNFSLSGNNLITNLTKYNTTYSITGNEPQGAVYWNADRQTLQLKMNGTNYDYGMGLFFYIKNQSGVQINKGDVVGFAGTLGMSGILLGAKYVNDGSQPSDRLMGVAKENIPNGGEGKVVFFGEVRGINTNAFTAGTILYASNVTAGALSSTVPNAGTNKGEIAAVVSQSSTVGTIFVRALTSKRLNEVDDVSISGATNGQALVYDNGIWKNGRNQYDVFPFNIKDNFFGLHLITSYIATSTLSSSVQNTNRRVVFYPMVLNNETSINTMSVLHNAANTGETATLTLYIYDDSNDGLPGVKLYQEISETGIFVTAQKEIAFTGFTQSLPAGNYWVGLHCRDLSTASGSINPTFIGGNLTRVSTGASTLTFTNNSNISYTVTNQTADLGDNPTLTRTSSTVYNDPQIFIKLNT
jgi:hypothetical protein